ncbi:DEAD/DEAH box helicase [Pseudochryseolinea flava]|uniref:Helicase n=1 Tax=Pseudochryseolinea flava TaxID=2059302 RepID=A0A364Y0R0_9BACT|nr:DEAD/DEAH box helicase [Pseudochryseolinea flava]RAV99674.1 helicase [Pseudochryseolinea flava]
MSLNNVIIGGPPELTLIETLRRIHSEGPVHLKDLETLSFIKRFHPSLFLKHENKLLFLLGLFYKTRAPGTMLEEFYFNFSEIIKKETGRNFTPIQARAFKSIKERLYFSFSAPTSSGKSFLFRELIKNAKRDIIIVLPSRALITEYMHEVLKIVDNTVLVLQFVDLVNLKKTDRRIFIITPERGDELFKHKSMLDIELLLFDEAQLSDEPIRGMRFDSLVRRTVREYPTAKKIFTHPFIQNPEAQLTKHNIIKTADYKSFSQNSVGKLYLSVRENNFKFFSPFKQNQGISTVRSNQNVVVEKLKSKGTVLIYTSKNKIYSGVFLDDFNDYVRLCGRVKIRKARQLINRLQTYIGATKSGPKKSLLIEMMEKGIVIHHGSMPLKARLFVEDFVNNNFAKMCFSTATLAQGINMPFDVVWISNFRFSGTEQQKNLGLKNLIGRAGRSDKNNEFNYGYVIVEERNQKLFTKRMIEPSFLEESSKLDVNIKDVPEDMKDVVEAIQNYTFDDELQLTKSQVQRIKDADLSSEIQFVLNNLFVKDAIISGTDYYKIYKGTRDKIGAAFKKIFVSHLRRSELTTAEMAILGTAIPILLWRIQGKSFKEIVSLRHAYLSQKDKQRQIYSDLKQRRITENEASKRLEDLKIVYSPQAHPIPDRTFRALPLFKLGTSVKELSYDILVYDTYDYIDKVISQCLSKPLTAAFTIFAESFQDNRARVMRNIVEYGTNDPIEIWLLRYGFDLEDVQWIKNHVKHIDENAIEFLETIEELDPEQYRLIERFV